MYDMDKCVDYVEIPLVRRDRYFGALAVIRIDGRVWTLMYEVRATTPEWFEMSEDFDNDGDMWYYVNNLIDRHYLEHDHGESFGSASMQGGAL